MKVQTGIRTDDKLLGMGGNMTARFKRLMGLALVLLTASMTWAGVVGPASAEDTLSHPGDHDVTLDFGNLKRHFILHVPAGYDAAKPIPLVVMLHGHGGTAKGISKVGWSQEADKETFLVAY